MTRGFSNLCLGFALLLLSAPTAYAQAEYARTGLYVGLGFNGAIEVFRGEIFPGVTSADIGNSFGVNVQMGYRVHPRFAVEVGYEFVEGFDIDGSSLEIETWILTVNAKAFLATGQFQPYGLFGVGVMEVDLEDSGHSVVKNEDVAVRFGAGLDFYTTENIVFFGEVGFVVPSDTVDNLDYLSLAIGARYRF